MENASDALKMAAAMLLFAGALTIAIMVLSRARQSAASIDANKEARKSFHSVESLSSEKEVGLDTVLTNMYNYYQTQSAILFYVGHKNSDGSVVIDNKVPLYYTEASDTLNSSKTNDTETTLDKSTLRINLGLHSIDDPQSLNMDRRAIYGLDIHDELTRQEPWTLNEEKAKQFIDALVNRKETPGYDRSYYSNMNANIAYGDGYQINYFKVVGHHEDVTLKNPNGTNKLVTDYKFHMRFSYDFNKEKPETPNNSATALVNMKDAVFVERIGIYNYEAFYDVEYGKDSAGNEDRSHVLNSTFNSTTSDSSLIYFDETNETIENNKGEKKNVIEYIYIRP